MPRKPRVFVALDKPIQETKVPHCIRVDRDLLEDVKKLASTYNVTVTKIFEDAAAFLVAMYGRSER